MKTLIYLLLLTTAMLSAQTAKSTKKAAPKAAPAPVPAVVTIPSQAVEQSDGSFHYTDPQGKKWLYRKTPFGVSKVEDKALPPVPAAQQDTTTIATDAGDSVHFEKPSPFGVVKWDKKKTELDSNEQSVWNRQKKQ